MRYIELVTTRRRYARSINLERNLDDTDALAGYVITPRAQETLALFSERFATDAVRAFTVTAVYGAGKSAFMHFLLALLSPQEKTRSAALSILQNAPTKGELHRFFNHLAATQPDFFRAVATSRGESITTTLARAIASGAQRSKSTAEKKAGAVAASYLDRAPKNKPAALVDAIHSIAETRPVIVVIDELGKNLEQAAIGENDVYLLQMLAELPQRKYPVYFFGLLHSAFSDYGNRLASRERAEWQKIQGRFEDIPFLDSSENMLSLIAAAIEQKPSLAKIAARSAEAWQKKLPAATGIWQKVFPLHPLAARALPLLCTRFGQNERSLFNYLTGHEVHSFHAFLQHTPVTATTPRLLRLADLYDYFIESASLASIERQSRLIELRDRVRAHEHLDTIPYEILKTIAVLNALSVGELKASRTNVILAMQNFPGEQQQKITAALDALLSRGILTYRKQADEYRLWAGSETDIESLIDTALLRLPHNLAEALNSKFPLRTIVAARHSFETGTLRYFPALFIDAGQIASSLPRGDGYILYDISERHAQEGEDNHSYKLPFEPATPIIPEGLPVIRVNSNKTRALRTLAREVLALESLMHGKDAFALDAVARREITERYYLMTERLRETIEREFFAIGQDSKITCTPELVIAYGSLSQIASALCDRVYHKGIILKNELINRQQISSQIAKARGEIVARLLQYRERAQEHFSGNGPEVSIFYALTDKKYGAKLDSARKAIRNFADAAREATPLSGLFARLTAPPYGVRLGVIPLLLVQYLLDNEDSISLYQDGSFIPEITPELLEILVRRPERFALKKFVLSGLEAQYFDALLEAYGGGNKRSLLAVIKPLVRFARALPRYTQQTQELSEHARKLRSALFAAREPDSLLFKEIPTALGVTLSNAKNSSSVRLLTKRLTQALHELQNAYLHLLENCRAALAERLRVPKTTELRTYLATIAGLLAGQVLDPTLRRFLAAAQDRDKNDQKWLEGMVMVIADKPAEAWRDDDRNVFTANLDALAQKFLNLHQLLAKVQAAGNGKFDARLVSITSPDGSEAREVVWIEQSEQVKVEQLRAELTALPIWQGSSERIKQALLVAMLQQAIAPSDSKLKSNGQIKITVPRKNHG